MIPGRRNRRARPPREETCPRHVSRARVCARLAAQVFERVLLRRCGIGRRPVFGRGGQPRRREQRRAAGSESPLRLLGRDPPGRKSGVDLTLCAGARGFGLRRRAQQPGRRRDERAPSGHDQRQNPGERDDIEESAQEIPGGRCRVLLHGSSAAQCSASALSTKVPRHTLPRVQPRSAKVCCSSSMDDSSRDDRRCGIAKDGSEREVNNKD